MLWRRRTVTRASAAAISATFSAKPERRVAAVPAVSVFCSEPLTAGL